MEQFYGFKPETKNVRNIFDGSNYYQIPDYQRPYSWGDEEIEQLWDDLKSAFDNQDESYFLGPVILAQTPDSLEVIDGQQRLTTLTILLCALRDLYLTEENSSNNERQILRRRILNAIESLTDKRYRLRLLTQAQYQYKFEQEILKKVQFPNQPYAKREKQKIETKFINASSIFRVKLSEIVDIEKIYEFSNYILEKVIMITVTCANRTSAIKLFQIINTRGLELSTADLVKSYLYGELTDDKRKAFSSTWQDIERIADQSEETVTDLLTYYTYYSMATKPKKSIYEELIYRIISKDDPSKFAYDFKLFVEQYSDIISIPSKYIHILRNLPDRVFWKTILTASKKENFPEFDDLIREIIRLYYSYWIAGRTMAKIRDFSFVIIDLVKRRISLQQIRTQINEKIRKDHVVENMDSNLKDDAYGEPWLKPLLVMIEYNQTDDSAFIEYDRNLHVDHILPEEWKKNVRARSYWADKLTEDQAKVWLGNIGNLTLLSGKKNIKASNDSFPEKRKIYQGKGIDGATAFLISQRVSEKAEWTINELKERQKWLLNETGKILNIHLSG